MKRVTTINLNGRAYQVEEEGYEALKAYLDKAEKTLAHNPDKEDIVNDIEQAIADKCDAELTSGKNVVSARVVQGILEKVGPVHETDDYDDEKVEVSTQQEQRKLYRLPKDCGRLCRAGSLFWYRRDRYAATICGSYFCYARVHDSRVFDTCYCDARGQKA